MRRWTTEEDERLRTLRLQFHGCDPGGGNGLNGKKPEGIRTIGEMMGRAKSSVYMRLLLLAEKDERENRW